MSSTLWTEPHFTGLVLILGALLFLCGAGLYTAVRDTKGSLIFGLPPREWLGVVFDHPRLWRWATLLFMCGVIVTILGLAMLTTLFRDVGDQVFSQLGLVAFVFGAVLWIIHLAFRLRVDSWAAQETARTAALPEFYVPLLHHSCLFSDGRLRRSGPLHLPSPPMGRLGDHRLQPGWTGIVGGHR